MGHLTCLRSGSPTVRRWPPEHVPPDGPGATSTLLLVGYWQRTPIGVWQCPVHAGWRTSLDTAVDVVRRVTAFARTAEPLRLAHTAAREAHSASELRR